MLVSEAVADAYFAKRVGASSVWIELVDKEAYLTTAEIQLGAVYTLPTASESLTDAQTWAICEQALFLLQDPDIDARASLQAQGVKKNELDGETYNGRGYQTLIAPVAASLLRGTERTESATYLGAATPSPYAYDPDDETADDYEDVTGT